MQTILPRVSILCVIWRACEASEVKVFTVLFVFFFVPLCSSLYFPPLSDVEDGTLFQFLSRSLVNLLAPLGRPVVALLETASQKL